LQRATGLAAVYPLLEGADALVPAIRSFLQEQRR
jgi:hypothetical protein